MSELNRRFAEERDNHERNSNELLHKIHELTERITILNHDNERLSIEINQRVQEIEGHKTRYEQLEKKQVADLEAVRIEINNRYLNSPVILFLY